MAYDILCRFYAANGVTVVVVAVDIEVEDLVVVVVVTSFANIHDVV